MKKLLLRRLLLLMACMLTSIPVVFGQNQVTVKGSVSDADGQPLIGAYVMPKDQNTGVTTDLDGKFSIVVPRGTILVFSDHWLRHPGGDRGADAQHRHGGGHLHDRGDGRRGLRHAEEGVVVQRHLQHPERGTHGDQAVRRAGLPPGQGPGPADPPAHG